jgi:hypothetical protein
MAVTAICAAHAQTIELKTAPSSPMQYYLSLPRDWSAARKWPVVIVIESARRDFPKAAREFVEARGDMPFILAVPMVITNGGSSYRQAPEYRYSAADWQRIEDAGGCRFDQEGIAAVTADLRRNYGAEDKYFLASWEAGGHTAWAAVFAHPEALRAATFSGPNYQARCVQFSSDAARTTLPVKVFLSGIATDTAPNKFVHQQSLAAKNDGEQHGFRAITLQDVAGKPHGPMPEEVLAWFHSLL